MTLELIEEYTETDTQYCLFDKNEGRVVARFANKERAQEILDKAKESGDNG